MHDTYVCVEPLRNDPAPTLSQLKTATLALWGELDNNIMADKNKPAWDAALKAAGNRDCTLVVVPKANHDMFEAKVGSNADKVAPAIRAVVFHDDRRLAREADSRLPLTLRRMLSTVVH